jgi:Flp pilus assembly pilin Flp
MVWHQSDAEADIRVHDRINSKRKTKGELIPMNLVNRFVTEDSGAETVEYALVLGLIALVAVAAITTLGTSANSIWVAMSTKI